MCELRRVACINSSGHPTSIFSFVRCECEQLIPRCVSDAFSKAVVLYQATNVQVFQKDHPKSVHQLSTFLVHKVVPAKLDPLMNTGHDSSSRLPLRRPFLLNTQLALRLCQGSLFLSKESRVVNLLASAESHEVRQANIDPNSFAVGHDRLWLNLNRKASAPFARRRSPDSQGLDLTLYRAVLLDAHIANLRQPQLAVERKSGLCIGERVVSEARSKPWEASLLATLFYPAKEVLKRLVQPAQHILQHLTMDQRQVLANRFDLWQVILLVGVPDRFVLKAVGITPLLQSSVVEFAAKAKRPVHAGHLCLARIDSVLITFSVHHMITSACSIFRLSLPQSNRALARALLRL